MRQVKSSTQVQAETSRLEQCIVPTLTDTCSIQYLTQSSDFDGSGSETWADVPGLESVFCSINAYRRREEKVLGDEVTGMDLFLLHLPPDTPVLLKHTILHNSMRYQIISMEQPLSMEPARLIFIAPLDEQQ